MNQITQMKHHVVLVGDSIFDNQFYVQQGRAVIHHLRSLLPEKSEATLLAHDGDLTLYVKGQLRTVPAGITHLIISVGGNDALHSADILSLRVSSVGDELIHLSKIRKKFWSAFRAMLRPALDLNLPMAVCTIYEYVHGLIPAIKTALALFNDTVSRDPIAANVGIIDLRQVCTEQTDFSKVSPIEPSEDGGQKIAQALIK